MKYKSLQQLDDVLEILKNNDEYVQAAIANLYRYKQPKDDVDIKLILDKLKKDKFIKVYRPSGDDNEEEYDNPYDYYYSIKFEGLVFLEQGGYLGQLQKEISKQNKEQSDIEVNKTLQYVIATTGAISAVYYILEIFQVEHGELYFIVGLFLFLIFFSKIFHRFLGFTTMQYIVVFILLYTILIFLLGDHLPNKHLNNVVNPNKADTSARNLNPVNESRPKIKSKMENRLDNSKIEKQNVLKH